LDRRPPKLPSTSSRLIAMAVSLVGDVETVRQEIGSSHADFRDYCAGQKEPPWPELDRLIVLIVREQGKLIAKNRELLAKIRGRVGDAS
jgi:hypothetical protein